MKPITDEEVAELPVDRGRAHLLETIMSTPRLEPARPAPSPTRRPWKAGLGIAVAAASVAATVIAIVVAPRWLDGGDPSSGSEEPAASDGRATAPADGGLYPVVEGLPAAWRFEAVSSEPVVSIGFLKEVEFQGQPGGMTFMVEVRDASDYEAVVDEETTQGGVRAGTIDVDGRTARVWRLTENPGAGTGECTSGCVHHWSAITPVEDGKYVLVIGAGLGPDTLAEREWRDLVAGVRLTDRAGFDAALPGDVVLPSEEGRLVGELMKGVEAPERFDVATIDVTDYSSTSGAAFEVGVTVACAWIAAGGEPRPEEWPLYAELHEVEQALVDGIATQRPEAVRACR